MVPRSCASSADSLALAIKAGLGPEVDAVIAAWPIWLENIHAPVELLCKELFKVSTAAGRERVVSQSDPLVLSLYYLADGVISILLPENGDIIHRREPSYQASVLQGYL